jgi:AbrB family looped-hinge helix DNA binding protein
MKKYSKPIKCDIRGQLVIPKDIRSDLNIEEGTGFLLYTITKEGILLKKIIPEPLNTHEVIINEINEKSDKLNLKKDNLKKSIKNYEKLKEGNLELI